MELITFTEIKLIETAITLQDRGIIADARPLIAEILRNYPATVVEGTVYGRVPSKRLTACDP